MTCSTATDRDVEPSASRKRGVHGGGRHVGEGCSYCPGSESDGKLAVAYLDRRGGRGDTEGQAGEPVGSGEPERECLRCHRVLATRWQQL